MSAETTNAETVPQVQIVPGLGKLALDRTTDFGSQLADVLADANPNVAAFNSST